MPAGRPRGCSRYRDLSAKGGHKRDCYNKGFDALASRVGGDVEGWVMDFLAKAEKNLADGTKMSQLHAALLESQPFKELMNGLNQVMKNLSDYNKRQIGSIFVAAGFTRKALVKSGVQIGDKRACFFDPKQRLEVLILHFCHLVWKSSREHKLIYGPGAPAPEQDRKNIPDATKRLVYAFLHEDINTRSSPDSMVWSKNADGVKQRMEVRYMEKTVCKLYDEFCAKNYEEVNDPQNPGQKIKKPLLSPAQFYRYRPKHIQFPSKRTGTPALDLGFVGNVGSLIFFWSCRRLRDVQRWC